MCHHSVTWTPAAEVEAGYERLLKRRESDLEEMLADWDRNKHPHVRAMMKELAKAFASAPPVRVGSN